MLCVVSPVLLGIPGPDPLSEGARSPVDTFDGEELETNSVTYSTFSLALPATPVRP